MTNSNSTEFTASDGRRFAFPVGTAFLLLAAILFWREKQMAMQVTAGLGLTLFVAGALIGIGKRNIKLNKAAIRAVKAIGPVEIDYGDNSCEQPDVLKHLTSDYLKKKLGT